MMSRVEGQDQDQDQDQDRRMVDQQDGETSQLIKSNPTVNGDDHGADTDRLMEGEDVKCDEIDSSQLSTPLYSLPITPLHSLPTTPTHHFHTATRSPPPTT